MRNALLSLVLLAAACASTPRSATEASAPAHCDTLERMRAAGPVELDAVPTPVGDTHFDIPKRLRREPVKGTAKVDLLLAEDGRVLQARVVETDLPSELGPHLKRSIESWQFTPPTVNGGCPVKIRAALPIPVDLR